MHSTDHSIVTANAPSTTHHRNIAFLNEGNHDSAVNHLDDLNQHPPRQMHRGEEAGMELRARGPRDIAKDLPSAHSSDGLNGRLVSIGGRG